MDAESLLSGIEVFLNHGDLKTYVLPTKGDPTEKQTEVSLMIMERVDKGEIPKFTITVKEHKNG